MIRTFQIIVILFSFNQDKELVCCTVAEQDYHFKQQKRIRCP